jgi:hypothetical protein
MALRSTLPSNAHVTFDIIITYFLDLPDWSAVG